MSTPKEIKEIRGQPFPAKLYATEGAESAKKALAEKDVPDPTNPKILEQLIKEAKSNGNA